MSPTFIDKNLQPGEVVRYRGRPSKTAALTRPVAILLVFAIVDGIEHSFSNSVTTAASHSAKTGGEIVVGIFLFFIAFALVINTIGAVAFLSSAQYAVTDRRVVAKYGLIKRSSVDIVLAKVSGVKVDQGLLGRLFDYGNVVVQASGASRRLNLIKSPKTFQSAIYSQLQESRLLKGTAAYRLDVKIAQPTSAPPLPPGTPAQWREDPFGGEVMRYWDGDRWTDHTAPAP